MATETTIHESPALAGPTGGKVTLRLVLAVTGDTTEIRIEREERLPHKSLMWAVLSIRHPSAGAGTPARDMTTIAHELERLHRQGYSLRQRSAGWRGAWHADLMPPGAGRAVLSWPIEASNPAARVHALSRTLASLDVPTPQKQPDPDSTVIAEIMREHGAELQRAHAIDALNAADPTLPADEFLEELETRGLLDPTESETTGAD